MARRLEEFEADLVRNVNDKLVRDLVSDFRNYSVSPGPPLPKVTVQGAGVVQTGDDGPKHRSFEQGQGGWVKPPRVDDWRPPGEAAMNQLMDQQDRLDRAQRIKELAEAARHLQAMAEAETEAKKLEATPKVPK
jgi:hypothetical protein